MAVGLPFANTFAFSRPIAAPYRNASGLVVNAGVNEARFDHDVSGNRLGLLVTTGPAFGQHDACSALPGDWENVSRATVLFTYIDENGPHRRAIYSLAVRGTIDACLNIVGHITFVGAVAGFLPNLGPDYAGYCRYRNEKWYLGNPIEASEGIALGNAQGNVLLESA